MSDNQQNTNHEEKTDFSDIEKINETGLPKQHNKKSKTIVVIAGLLVLLIFWIPKLFKSNDEVKEVTQKPKEEVSVKPRTNFNFTNPEEKTFETTEKTFETAEKPPFLLGEPEKETESINPYQVSKSTRNFMIKSGQGSSSSNQERTGDNSTDEAISQAEGFLEGNSENANNDSDIFKAPAFSATKAQKGAYNPHLLLSQGTLIPCVLRGRLVSNINGQISCIIADNVYSQSGNVVLLEKGSRVNGYYQGNSAKHGSNEIFAVWQEIRTPSNLVIPLNSGSTDEVGANGLRGWADNHFWDRFKNAILLSMIRDVTGILANESSKNGRYDYTENTREGSEDIAKTILDQMGDIRPTIYKNQGDKVGIFVARDIDFSNVYALKRKK